MLTNQAEWVFDDVHQQKLIALVTADASLSAAEPVYRLTPEYHSKASWDIRNQSDVVKAPLNWLREYSPTLVLPLLPTTRSFEVIQRFMKAPRLDQHPVLKVRRVYADFETSRDRRFWHGTRDERDWPVKHDGEASPQEAALVGLIRSGLLKRCESSAYAFSETCRRMADACDAFLKGLDQGVVLTAEGIEEWQQTDNDEILDQLLAKESATTVGLMQPTPPTYSRRCARR
jgi:hypothetical protein